jgi:hypothetical protein
LFGIQFFITLVKWRHTLPYYTFPAVREIRLTRL